MEAGEKLQETLKCELEEEINQPHIGKPYQPMTFLTNISIPTDNVRMPLMFVVYDVYIAK
jgi:hypothetical protein